MIVARRKADQNQAVIDPWTAVHTAMGLAAGLMGLPFLPMMAAAVAYEVIEHSFEDSEAGQRFFDISGPETIGNVMADLAVFGVGWYLGAAWNTTALPK